MLKAFKYRIYPNSEQKEYIAKTFGCTRFIYNKMLDDKIEHYNQIGEMLKNIPAQYKKEFEWLKEVDSLALANAQ
jgi:putative transposase